MKLHYSHPRRKPRDAPLYTSTSDRPLILVDIPAGGEARLRGFSAQASSRSASQLQALGLVPGEKVLVLQHFPVTIVRVDHAELAIERSLATLIEVEAIQATR